jgi:hypothetical protein
VKTTRGRKIKAKAKDLKMFDGKTIEEIDSIKNAYNGGFCTCEWCMSGK